MAGARLRQTFKYPSDGEGSDVSHDEMDEEEQEHFITNLRTTETTTNKYYILFFAILPLAITLSFTYTLLFLSTTKSTTLACLLSITSLLSSSYIMYMIPTGAPLFSKPTSSHSFGGVSRGWARRHLDVPDLFGGLDSPLTKFLPFLNIFISALLVLVALSYRSKPDIPDGLWIFFLLPGFIFATILVVRTSISEIQTGLTELQGMRYEYKGA